MTFTWTENMKNVGASKDLEAHTRTAVLTAVELWSKLPADGEQPRFNGGAFLNPANDIAKMMAAAATDHLPDTIVGRQRATIVTTAFALATIACADKRRGGAAWAHLAELLTVKKPTVAPATPASPANP